MRILLCQLWVGILILSLQYFLLELFDKRLDSIHWIVNLMIKARFNRHLSGKDEALSMQKVYSDHFIMLKFNRST
jgi:hypothetical protein